MGLESGSVKATACDNMSHRRGRIMAFDASTLTITMLKRILFGGVETLFKRQVDGDAAPCIFDSHSVRILPK
jgi:hypothetical protein